MLDRYIRSTLQIGEPAVIANRTGITTVADFRPADMALGGQGAPLITYVDKILFRDERLCTVVLNIGGIANVTFLPPEGDEAGIQGFDTGPGNMIINAIVTRFTGARQTYDQNGEIAFSAEVDERILNRMLEHPYLTETPPKSTGREDFGDDYVNWIVEIGREVDWRNLVATAAAFTAYTIADAVESFLEPYHPPDRIIVSGGGAKNRSIIDTLKARLPEVDILVSDKLGIPADAKEAVGFAILGNETLHGVPSNVAEATGAERPAILGKIIPV